MAMIMSFLCGILCFAVWIPANSFAPLIVFALICGPTAGTFWAVSFTGRIQGARSADTCLQTVGPVSVEVVGLKNLPAALSLEWIVLCVPCTFSEVIALEIAERTKAMYLGTQLFTAFTYLAAGGSLLALRYWKIGAVERERLSRADQHPVGFTNNESPIPNEKAAPGTMRQRFFALSRV